MSLVESDRPMGSVSVASAHPLGVQPSKVIAVHVNYASRAAQRGRIPSEPSYFLKPPSSLAWDGSPVVRPKGCELLSFEGELAVVIGTRARNVTPEDAHRHIAGYTAANDFGVHDLRWADRGSNVLSKGHDGYTPIGPSIVPAGEVDPLDLQLRTLVNGDVVQDDTTANLLFPPALLVADLSRVMTLEPGDIVLTGTPANTGPVVPGDTVTVEITGIGSLTNPIVESELSLASFGAMPRVTDRDRAWAGVDVPPRRLAADVESALRSVSTATLTVQLRQRGVRNTFIGGLRPTRPDLRMVGFARTLRYVPLREDVAALRAGELNAQKRAVESISEGEVLVIDARGEAGAGTIGDILATRALARGAAGIVSDGGLRDSPAFATIDLPTYYQAAHAAPLGLLHHPLEMDRPVACGGVLVLPGDVVVGDAEGALVIPATLVEEVAIAAREQEERERWSLERVQAGESIQGVYPISEERMPEFEAWRHRAEPQAS